MNCKSIKILAFCLLFFLPCTLGAQQPKTPEEEEKELRDFIDKQIERYEETLELEDWQVFYADSILMHDFFALSAELKQLSASKVENPDIYQISQDKWAERMYESFRKILNPSQWAKYLKTGAAKEKAARDKRAAKRK